MDGTFWIRFADGEKMMSTALLLGLIWSGLWMAYLYVVMKCFPWEMLHDYPEDAPVFRRERIKPVQQVHQRAFSAARAAQNTQG